MLTIRIVLIRGVFSAFQMLYRPHGGGPVELQLIRDDPGAVSEWVLFPHDRCAIDGRSPPVLHCIGRTL